MQQIQIPGIVVIEGPKIPKKIETLQELCLNEISDNFKINPCSKVYGYVLKIVSITLSSEHIVALNGAVHIEYIAEANVFQPKVGVVVDDRVLIVSHQGIICRYLGLMNTIIPVSSLETNGFHYERENFVNALGEKLKVGDSVRYIIHQTKYKKGQFSCIGILVTNQ
jgi:DNA-directed RNA polymerase subunit E'/Rpb7